MAERNMSYSHVLAGGWAEAWHKSPQGTIGVIVLIGLVFLAGLFLTRSRG